MRGLALLEVAVAIAVLTVLAVLAMPVYSNWSTSSRVATIHDEANLLLTAIDEHYRRNCAVVPFPQPTLANLKTQQILVHQPLPNTDGGQWTFAITGVKTSTPIATVYLPFNDAGMASKVASRNRSTTLQGSQVVWRRSLTLNRESGAIGATSQHIFSLNGC